MRSLVIGASGGIGAALMAALATKGEVLGLSQAADGLDVTDEARVSAALGGLEGPFDLIVVATGALVIDGVGPEKTLRAVTAGTLAAQFAVNAIGPALVIKHGLRLLPRDQTFVSFGIKFSSLNFVVAKALKASAILSGLACAETTA